MQDNAQQPTQKDKYEIILDEQKVILETCQNEHNVDSCMKCEQILNCATRDMYVKSVYESMNKGEGGGFEF
jgi:hypothetical protein